MALHFDLMVNNEPIGRFVAQRREPVVPADGICTYDVTITSPALRLKGVVFHNYDDGAFRLVHRSLAKLFCNESPVARTLDVAEATVALALNSAPPVTPVERGGSAPPR